MGVSACLIVRDEEQMLPRCLESVKPWVDQICVLDTGSVDATIGVARSFGADVAEAPWEDDFSKARNISLKMARHPWIIVIDADEELDHVTGPKLREIGSRSDELAFLVVRDDLRPHGPPDRLALARILRNDPRIEFRRPVHESIMDSLFELGGGSPEDSGVRLIHYGYLPEAMRGRNKHDRNLSVLRRHRVEAPDDLYAIFKLAVTLPWREREEKLDAFGAAHAIAQQLEPNSRAQLPFLPTLYDAHAATLSSYGKLSRAIEMAEEGRIRYPDSARLQYRRGELAQRAGDLEVAERHLRRALEGPRASAVEVDRSAQLDAACCAALMAIAAETGRPAQGSRDGRAWASEPIQVQMARVRYFLYRGLLAEASAALQPLLESHFHEDDVRLFGGEIAFAQGDFDTAFALWSLTNPETDSGHRAEAWLDLLMIRRGEVPRRSRPPRDAAAAAMKEIVRLVGGYQSARDPAFRPDAVSRWTDRWLAELNQAGGRKIAPR